MIVRKVHTVSRPPLILYYTGEWYPPSDCCLKFLFGILVGLSGSFPLIFSFRDDTKTEGVGIEREIIRDSQ